MCESSQTQSALEAAGFQAVLDGDEEPGCVRAVDQSVVIGQGQVDHRPDRDRLAQVGVADYHRTLDYDAGAEDRHLWLIDDRVSNRAPRLPVLVSVNVPPESSSGLILFVAYAGRDQRSCGDTTEVEVAGVVDDRNGEPGLGVDCDAQVFGIVVGDRLFLDVEEALSTG